MDDRLRAAAGRWGLTVVGELTGGARSGVYAVTDADGRDLVLKLPALRPGPEHPAAAEAEALRIWASTGVVVLLVAATPTSLLLERIRPGRPWARQVEIADTTVEATVGMAAELLPRIWTTAPQSFRFPTLADVYPVHERSAHRHSAIEQGRHGDQNRGAVGVQLLPRAASAAQQLIGSASTAVLLHGDFISKNVLSDARSPIGWSAIDPQPMVGEPAADVAAFAAYQPSTDILPVAETLAARTGTDPQRTLRWAAIWAVHQAAQAWRQDQPALDRLVTSTEVTRLLQ